MKQRERIVARAVKRLDAAAESLSELASLASECDVDTSREDRFISDLKERASYWERCKWWRERTSK